MSSLQIRKTTSSEIRASKSFFFWLIHILVEAYFFTTEALRHREENIIKGKRGNRSFLLDSVSLWFVNVR